MRIEQCVYIFLHQDLSLLRKIYRIPNDGNPVSLELEFDFNNTKFILFLLGGSVGGT